MTRPEPSRAPGGRGSPARLVPAAAPPLPVARRRATPTRCWVSEVMLQQTQAARVVPPLRGVPGDGSPTWRRSRASRRVRRASGRGHGSGTRGARSSLHRAARADRRGARRADARATSRPCARSPGSGRTPRNAIAAIAYGRRGRRRRHERAADHRRARRSPPSPTRSRSPSSTPPPLAWLPPRRVAAWTQALMDLGRDVCRPLRPVCDVVPVRAGLRVPRRRARRPAVVRSQPRFEGSPARLAAGSLAATRDASSVPVAGLAARIGVPPARADAALAGLTRDGLVVVARGRVRLA